MSAAAAYSSNAVKLAAIADEGVFISRDSGSTWKNAGVATNQIWRCVTSSADGTKLAVAGHAGVCLSADSGATWTLSPAPANLASVGSMASSADGFRLYVAFNGGSCLGCGGPVYALQTEQNGR